MDMVHYNHNSCDTAALFFFFFVYLMRIITEDKRNSGNKKYDRK